MAELNLDDIIETALELYEQKQYAQAYAYMTTATQQAGLASARIYNFRICLANLKGQPDLALRLFAEALDKGYWSHAEQMAADEDLLTLHDNPEFQRLLAICRVQHAAAQQAAKPELRLLLPSAPTPAPLLVAFHGNQHHAADTAPLWEPLTTLGWCVAVPQSSQMSSTNAFVWNDLEVATAETRRHAETLAAHPRIDFKRAVVAGFSMGARVALWSALQGIFPARGLILLGPWLPELPAWSELLPRLAQSSTRTYLIIGDADRSCLPHAQALATALRERSLPVELELHPGLRHRYPPDFAASLQRALDFFGSLT